MRVSIVSLHYAPEATGNAPYVAGLAEGLAARGHDVEVVTAFPFYPSWRVAEGYEGTSIREHLNGVDVVRFRPRLAGTGFAARALTEIHAGIRARQLIDRQAEVVLLVSPALFQVGTLLAVSRRVRRLVPRVVWVQDFYSLGVRETGGSPLMSRVMTWLEGSVLRRASSVVTIHDRFTRYAEQSLGVSADVVKTVRNWSHVEPRESDRATVRERFGWREEECIVLHAGNQGKKQGLENVLRAAKVADDDGLPIRFVLLGDGNQRASLEAQATGLKRIQFIDPVGADDFMPTLQAADILLVNELPGLNEMSVPSKLTSYYAAGRPTVAATSTGSVTADEVTAVGGVIVPADDPRALVDAAIALHSDTHRSRDMANQALLFRNAHLTEESAITAFETILVGA